MELIEVLNSEGNKTGKILDKNEIHRLGLYHKEVAIFLINDKNEILLQKRANTLLFYFFIIQQTSYPLQHIF